MTKKNLTIETLNQHPEPTPEQLEEAARLRQQADLLDRKAQVSFDRCDTDGFLSQWALGLSAGRDRRNAEILEHGGCARFRVLVTQGNRVLDARMIDGEYGPVWILDDDEVEAFARRFIPIGERSRVQKRLGLREIMMWRPARAIIKGRGTGLSGTAYVGVIEEVA